MLIIYLQFTVFCTCLLSINYTYNLLYRAHLLLQLMKLSYWQTLLSLPIPYFWNLICKRLNTVKISTNATQYFHIVWWSSGIWTSRPLGSKSRSLGSITSFYTRFDVAMMALWNKFITSITSIHLWYTNNNNKKNLTKLQLKL